MHTEEFTRGKGRFMLTTFVPTDERANRNFPLILTTGRILVALQCRRADPAHRQQSPGIPRTSSRSILTTRKFAASRTATSSRLTSRVGATTLKAKIADRMPQGVVYTTFHHPATGANVITTENSDWATNCPEYKVTAVQVTVSNHPSEWQEEVGGTRGREQAHLEGKDDWSRRSSLPATVSERRLR